jgi:hypothetical protein
MFNPHKLPKSVEEVVNHLLSDLSLNNEIQLSVLQEDDLTNLHFSLGHHIRNSFGLWTGNDALMESCRIVSGNQNLHVDDASMVIVKELWKKVTTSNILNNEESNGQTA